MIKFITRGSVLTITVGLPACGKTTFASSAGFDVAISLDDCRDILWGNKRIQNGAGGMEVLLAMQEKWIESAMKTGKSIIVHNTNILKKHREPLIRLAKKHEYRSQIVYFDVPLEECIKRNRQRREAVPETILESFATLMEVPTAEEADLVINYKALCEMKWNES